MRPNFFIVGAPRCGTTSIAFYLNQHPEAFISELKEPYYFSRLDFPDNLKRESMITDKKKYLDLFKKAKGSKAIGEASAAYLSSPHAPAEIKEEFPDAKIIISLRNPIERAHSSYFGYQFMHQNKQNFSEMIDLQEKQIEKDEFFIYSLLEPGFYSKHIKRFQENFSSDKIKIIIFEDYIKNTIPTIESILSFLDIDTKIEFQHEQKGSYSVPKNKISKGLLENLRFRKLATKIVPTVTRQNIGNKFFLKQTKKPKILEKDRIRLKKMYENEVNNLENMLGRKLPWIDFNNN